MERDLDNVIDEVISTEGVTGCLFADQQGLCLGAKGKISTASAGIIVAISEQCCKLQPNQKPPIIHLEADNRQCIIQKQGTLTAAIFKIYQ